MRFQVLLLSVLGAFSLMRASVAADVDSAANTNSAPAAPAVLAAATDSAPSNVAPTANVVAATNALPSTNTVPATPAPIVAAAPEPPATVTTNAPAANTGIRFDFNGMPYADALQRFAQMAGKPLIADTAVEGTLTFSDPKPYTYGEALDTLNLILATKNVMLVEADRYLRLVPFKALPQMPLKLLHGLENVGDVRPGEIVTVVLDLKNLDAGELSQPISSMLSAAGSVASLSRGRGLIVTDRLENIQRVRQLLTEIDTASPVQRQVKIFNLRRVSGTLMADLLNRTFGIATAPKRTVFNEQRKSYEVLPPDPTDYVTAIFAEASNTLVLFGPSERIAMASDLIDRFESEAGARASEIKVFYPQMPVEELAGMIRQAIPGVAGRGDRGGDNETKAKVIADTTSNRLIVTAPAAGQLDAITALIQRLDPSTQETAPSKTPGEAAPARELRVVDLKSGSAQALAPMLREAMTDLGRNPTGPTTMAQVRIQAAPFGNRLLLTGTPEALNDVMRLVEQLDTVSEPAEVTRVFKLRNSNAGRLANLIMSAMGGYGGRRRGGGGGVAAASEDRSNCLIVAASEAQMKTIEELVKQLEEVGGDAGRQLKIVELTNNSASTVAGTLARLFAPQVNSSDPAQRIVVTPTPNDKALVVEADEKMLPRIEEAVKTLDTATATAGIELRVVEVKSGSAQALGSMLREAMDELGRDRSRGGAFSQVHVQPSPVGNRLLLTGPAEALDRVEKLIAQLDNVESSQTTRVFKMKSADARQVANLIMSAMGGYEARRRGGGFVAAAAEERSNCVIVSAPDAQMKLVEDVINRLEAAGSLGGRQLRILALTNNPAATVVNTLRQLFAPQVSNYDPAKRVALTAAPNDQAVVIEADPDMMPRLEEAVKALDAGVAGPGVELRVVEIKTGSAQALAPMLQQTLAELSRQGGSAGALTQVHVQPSPVGNRLLLSGPAEALDRVGKLIAQLDSMETAQSTKVFKLANADARQVANMIMSAMGGYEARRRGGPYALAAAEERSNCVIVSASDTSMKMVEEVINRLEEAGKLGGRQLKMLALTNNSAAIVVRTLREMFAPQVNNYDPAQRVALTAAPNDQAVLVEADEQMMPRLETAVKALDAEAARPGVELRVVEIKSGSAQALAPMLQQALGELARQGAGAGALTQVHLQPSPVGNRLLVSGPTEALDRVGKLIEQLDNVETAQGTKVFKLKNADARQVANMIMSAMGGYESRRRGGATVSAAAEERSNCVVVSAPDAQMKLVAEVITRLDEAGGTGGRQLKILPVTNNSAASIAAMVAQLFFPQIRTSDASQRIAVTAAPDDRALVVEAEETMMPRLEEAVQALDVEPARGTFEVRTYALPEGRSGDLAASLGRLFTEQDPGRRRFDLSAPPSPPAPRFEFDSASEMLIVAATAEQFTRIDKVLDDLRAAAAMSSQIRTFRLEHAEPAQVVDVLQSMLLGATPQQWRGSRGYRGGSGTTELRVAAAPALNAVVVQASPEKLAVATQLIKTLDKPRTDGAAAVQTVHLQKAQADAVASAVTAALTAKNPPNTPPSVSVTAVPGSRSLLVNGPEVEVAKVLQLIHDLDQESPSDQPQTRVYRLENGDARELARVMTQLLQGLSRSQPRFASRYARDTFTVAADDRTNSLIVSGTPECFALVEQLLPALDQSPQHSDRQVQFYWLQNADAFDVSMKADALFADRPKAERPVIEPDSFANSITVVAKPADLVDIEAVVQKLDSMARDTSLVVRMIPLSDIPVERMATMLTNIYPQMSDGRIQFVDRLSTPPSRPVTPPASGGTGAPAGSRTNAPAAPPATTNTTATVVTIAMDKTANALIASGPAYELDHIQSLVTELSLTFATPEFEIRQFRLKEADPVVVARVLNELFKPEPVPGQPNQRSQQPGGRQRSENGGGQGRQAQGNPPPGQPQPPQQPGQPPPIAPPKVAVVAESRTHSVIVRARPADFTLLESIIKQLDEGGLSAELAHRLVPLEHVTPERVLPLVRQMLTQLSTTRPGEPVAVAGDPRSRGIFLVGRASVLDQVEALVHELDTSSEFAELELETFPLKFAQAAPLANLLRGLLRPDSANELTAEARQLQEQVSRLKLANEQGELIGLDLTQPIKIVSDPQQGNGSGANRLVIASTPNNLKALAAVITLLDSPSAAGAESFRVFPLTHADATGVLRVLSDLAARSEGGARARLEERPSLSVDERTNTLIASGTEKALELVAKLVEQLDRDLPDDLRSIRILPLEHADATAIATSLQRLLDARSQQRGGGGRAGGGAMRVVVIADPRSNSLLVSGGPDNYELVKSLVTQLDQPGMSLVGQVRLIPLQHADAGTLATTLSDLFNRRYQAARTPELQRDRPVILGDPRSNSLLVAASRDDNRALDALLEKLDREPENPAVELTVIGLQFNDSARIAATIQGVFAARLQSLTPSGQRPAPSDRVDVQADSLSNALVISANKPNLELIRGLIAKLDAEPIATGGMIQTFTLQHADVQRVAALLGTLVQQGIYRPGISAAGGRRSPRDALAVVADAQSNTLIVSASPENLVIVKELIKQLDTPEYNAAGDIKLYPLKHARASHLATVLEQFFRAKRSGEVGVGAGAGQRSAPVTVTADDRTNSLLITGGKESFAAIDRLVEQLDTEFAVGKSNFRVFELKHTTATKLQGTLQRLFSNRPTRGPGEATEPVTVIADGWSNALIIGASDDDLALAASLIEKLDTEQPTGGPQVQVFQLAKADARRVEQTLQSLFRGTSGPAGPAAGGGLSPVVINVDERLNAIIVSAGETDLKRVGELVKKLDTDQVARVAEIRIFPLKNARAAEMATVLNNVLNSNPKELTDASPNRQSLLQFMARSTDGEQLLTSALKEGIIIVADPRANSLVVSAPLDYMDLLDRMIQHLDETAPTVAKIKIFNLKNADARQMALVLTSLFRLQPTGGPATANQQFIQYTMPAGGTNGVAAPAGAEETTATVGSAEEDALSVTVDLRTNSLLIGGTEHYVELATQIIQTLDDTPAQERKAQVYRLKNARSQAVETSLRTFLQQDLQRITTILGPAGVGTAQNVLDREVSIVSETNSNTLLISASPRYFEEVEKLVEELDKPQPQVLIQVLLAEVTLDSTTELGVEWTYASKGSPSLGTGTDFGQQQLLQDFGGYWASVTGSNYKFLLRALQNDGRLEVLSRPQILTADNQEATINIGQRVPFVTSNQLTPQGGTVNSFIYQNVGVILQVTPRISPDGYVKMDLAPSISDLSSSTVDISPGVKVPIVNQRTATTAVTVKSGESVLIGGLIGTIDDVRTKKVPLLGDIPGLGALFRSRSNAKTRKELLIVLTPQILLKGSGEGKGMDAKVFTDQELKASDLKNQLHRDPLQRRLIEQIYPPDQQPGNPSELPKSKKPDK